MEVLHLTEDNFENTLKSAKQFVIVDFWAPWCGPCKMLGPVFEKVASQFTKASTVFAKVCVDDAVTLSRKYSVMSIPTIIIFSLGDEVARNVGYIDEEELLNLLASLGIREDS